jgi:hypothetical protein
VVYVCLVVDGLITLWLWFVFHTECVVHDLEFFVVHVAILGILGSSILAHIGLVLMLFIGLVAGHLYKLAWQWRRVAISAFFIQFPTCCLEEEALL